jgi:L-threonylcarbamoyladenylate synthase
VQTERLVVDPVAPSPRVIARAAAVLRGGGLVAFPTETFYGLGAAALDPSAVARIFALKARPASKAVLVLVDSIAMARTVAADIPEAARVLMERHWPGALTLVVRAASRVPAVVTAGTGTIGIRLSSHPVARALVEAVGEPVTAPSANPADLEPPTTADAVTAYFSEGLALVLDAGPTAGGPPSTVLDVTVDPPRVLRAGAVRV